MGLAWRRLRHEWRRALATGLSVLVAVAAFVVLTGSAETARLRTTATVNANFRSSYDVLVRPRGSQTAIEKASGKVRPNYLSGIFGGITTAQAAQVRQVPGVQVAAPIAMVGEVLQTVDYPVDVTSLVGAAGPAVLRFTVTAHDLHGLATAPSAAGYVYVGSQLSLDLGSDDLATVDSLPGGRTVTVCQDMPADAQIRSPFDPRNTWSPQCWDRAGGLGGGHWVGKPGQYFVLVPRSFPVMVAAIDPAAEAALAGVDRAVLTGRYLTAQDGPVPDKYDLDVPVVASATSMVQDTATVRVDRLGPAGAGIVRSGVDAERKRQLLLRQPGQGGTSATVTAQQALDAWLTGASAHRGGGVVSPQTLFTTSAVTYTRRPDGVLVPKVVTNDPGVWSTSRFVGMRFAQVPAAAADTSYRTVTAMPASPAEGTRPPQVLNLTTVGTFDPGKLTSGSALSEVPLETYRPPSAVGADAATRRLLGGQPLLPDTNPAGYLQAPPLMLTTLAALPAFASRQSFDLPAGSLLRTAPISVVRVRVAGVTGADPVSREKVRLVAERIRAATGLDVDITVGSSPAPETVQLPATVHGAPALRIRENWVQKGVATAIITAIDRKSLALFVLILVTTALSVAISVTASVRARRVELGVLACLGWRPRTLLRHVLGELLLIGLAAGVAGAAVSVPLGHLLAVPVPWWRALLAVPAAALLVLVAGMVPARRAAGAVPAEAVRPAVSSRARPMRLRGVLSMSLIYLRRTPGRAAAGALSLAMGVAALTLLLGITRGFQGAVVGTLLGDTVSVQVRTPDLVAGVLLAAIGLGCLVDILHLDIREQAARYASLQAAGWRDSTLAGLVVGQAAAMGLVGALVGAAAGLAGLGVLAPPTAQTWVTAAAVAATGVALACLVALAPARALTRLPTAQLLAEE